MQVILRKKLGLIGQIIAWYYRKLEQRLLRNSSHIIAIAENFQGLLEKWSINQNKVSIIPNWAPISELPIVPKDNVWARAKNLNDKFVFLYTGTLGLKHNPRILLDLAIGLKNYHKAVVVVNSAGIGVEWLEKERKKLKLDNLRIFGYQPYSDLPAVLGTADVTVALLEPGAAAYSVPSKILSYLCSGTPILFAAPIDNMAAELIQQHRAGKIIAPDDNSGMVAAAVEFMENSALRIESGKNARACAESLFDINSIGARFLEIFNTTTSR